MFDPNQFDCSPQVEFAAKAFIASWLIDPDDRIETYLEDIPEDMQVEAHDVMIRLELFMRSSSGESLADAEYLKRFPDFKQEVLAAFNQDHSQMSEGSQLNSGARSKAGAHLSTTAAENISIDDELDTRSESMISEESDFILAKSQSDEIPDQVGRYRVESELGRGGFGIVCLAHDTQLDRKVALKFARTSKFQDANELEKLIDEARTAAKLDCPGIVSVYDVIVEDDFICIVQQLVEGHDLSDELANNQPTFDQAANWMALICTAIAVAHSKGFIHRDMKPANILLDKNDQPLITDFGLAIHESFQRRRRGDRSGTPSYMSPELVRGESHRIDGRSDIWSLGVILYLMLTGKKPFSGDSAAEIFDEIKHREPRPPREIRPEIPIELERICLKCLSKPVAGRYATARDMARDLKRWLQDSATISVSDSMSDRISEVVPKGLRSFDEEDADFFLMLLPGPVGRSGLPDSVQAWKRRFTKESANPLTVGVLYGPSGCGKSSYVKAGLLPYLPNYIKTFRVEATQADTELRLIKSLRSRYSKIPSALTLPELFQSIREGVWTEGSDRILIVIDQFEQWLHNRNSFEGTELVEALRQCDGKRLQCLLMVRDDFWLATSRFLHALEVDLVEGKNAALIDLFDVPHAERVLKQYGRGYGRIGEELTKQNEEFIHLAVEQLAEDGKVICVRLSLFAEMFKDKPWDVASLKRAGGISGVGVAFLEETFSSKNSPAKNRVHEVAARNTLAALLPESSVDIRGNMRSRQDLMHLSGYANRPNAFVDLLNLLDHDLRLITPTDPAGMGEVGSMAPGASHDFYQLTHDYLVAPLRVWLNQKNRETASGRARLKLDERHATWTRTKETRFLPAVFEYINVRTLTRKKNWSAGEREMMGKADRHYGIRFAAIAAISLLAAFAGMKWYGNVQAHSLANRLIDAELSEVPTIAAEMERRNLHDRVASIVNATDLQGDRRKMRNVEIAFSDQDDRHAQLWQRLNNEASAAEAVIAADAYQPNDAEIEELWTLLKSDRSTETDLGRLRAATALSIWDAEDARWPDVGDAIAGSLLEQNPILATDWFKAMPSIRVPLIRELIQDVSEWQFGTDPGKTRVALSLIREHHSSWPEISEQHLIPEMEQADFVQQTGKKPEEDIEKFELMTQRQANLATILLVLEDSQYVLDQLNELDHERLQKLLVRQAATLSVEPSHLLECLPAKSRPMQPMRRPVANASLWLMLGHYDLELELPSDILEIAKSEYQSNPHAAVHSAAEWFIRHSGQQEWIEQQESQAVALPKASLAYPNGQNWRITPQKQTMIRIVAPGRFSMSYERYAIVDYDFEVSSKETSIEQFLRFNDKLESVAKLFERGFYDKNFPNMSHRRPVANINWYQAAEYCNWLSEQEGIPKDQWCYEVDPDPAPGWQNTWYEQPDMNVPGKPVLRLVADFKKRSGYRLPLESEWEYLAAPSWIPAFETKEYLTLLADYEWFDDDESTKPCGDKRPCRFGLFDIFSNTHEFSSDSATYFEELFPQDSKRETTLVKLEKGSLYQDTIELSRKHPSIRRSNYPKLVRGISYFRRMLDENREWNQPTQYSQSTGFRVVRIPQDNE